MFRKINLSIFLIFLLLGIYFARVHLPAGTTDTYWHLSVGRQVWQEKQIPKVDKFVYGSSDTSFTSTEWLSGLIFYTSARYLGFNGLLVLRVLAGLGALYFLYLALRQTGASSLLINLTILVTGYVLAIRLEDRPEIFSLLFVSIVNYSCFYYYLRKKLPATSYLLPVTFLLWPNIHGFAILGFSILGFWIGVFLFEKVFLKVTFENFAKFLAIFILAVFLSGWQLNRLFYFSQVAESADFAITEMVTLGERITEVKYGFFNQIPVEIYIYFLVFAIFLGGLIALLRRGVSQFLIVISIFYLAILLLPFWFFRLIPIVLLVTMPWTLYLVLKAIPSGLLSRGQVIWKVAFGLLIGTVTISAISGNILGGRSYRKYTTVEEKVVAARYRTWAPLFPFGAEQIIENHLATKRLFTANFWNNYFIWYRPEVLVFADAMFEYRTWEDFRDEKTLLSGGDGWEKLIDKYDIDTVVTSQPFANGFNETPIYKLVDWRLIFVDETYAVYARGDVVKSQPVDLSAFDLSLDTPLKFKDEDKETALKQLEALLAFDKQNGFARAQLVQYYLLNDLSRAKTLAEESRKLLSDDPIFSVYLAGVHATLGNCDLARQFGQEAKRKSFNDYNFRYLVNKALSACGGMI